MFLDECRFVYGNFDSADHNLMFAHIDTSEYNALAGDIETASIFNRRTASRNYIGTNYESSPVSFEAEIVTRDGSALSKESARAVEKALFNKPGFYKLKANYLDGKEGDAYEYLHNVMRDVCNLPAIDDAESGVVYIIKNEDSVVENEVITVGGELSWHESVVTADFDETFGTVYYYVNSRFINPTKIIDDHGNIYGYRFTLECDSLMKWQEDTVVEQTISNNHSYITINVDSDLADYIYPKVTLNFGSSASPDDFVSAVITNNTDNILRHTTFDNVPPNTVNFITDGNTNYVSDGMFENFTSRNFVRLVNGNNLIVVSGYVTSIKFEFKNRRFL